MLQAEQPSDLLPHSSRVPSWHSAMIFSAKVAVLIFLRALRNLVAPVQRHPLRALDSAPAVLAESRSPLWSDPQLQERAMQLGKAQNLRSAVRRLNGACIPAGEIFSFWKQIGRASQTRGYVEGRELRLGCIIPTVGGGLCQLSNALYDLALQTGQEIVERHAHSLTIPGAAAAPGRDATVAWNYIDLRFRAKQSLLIEAFLNSSELVVRFRGTKPAPLPPPGRNLLQVQTPAANVNSCFSCGEESCFRHRPTPQAQLGRTAFLLDDHWPEFQHFLSDRYHSGDVIAVPFPVGRWTPARYRWRIPFEAKVVSAPQTALQRSIESRHLQAYGSVRIRSELANLQALAKVYSRKIPFDVTHVVADQALLPFLWREGVLGGRTFEVLLKRLPLRELHRRLDELVSRQPQSRTAPEFRASDWLVQAETEALAAAQSIVTPNRDLAAMFRHNSVLLEWSTPKPLAYEPGPAILFPGPTAARKGAYELRQVAREMQFEVALAGTELEGPDFWEGVVARRHSGFFIGIFAVVQPAYIEEKPQLLLAALASGVPVIATEACGLPAHELLTLVPAGDVAALREVIASAYATRRAPAAAATSGTL